jgi:beta-glucosidase
LQIKPGKEGERMVEVTITNTGDRDGEEVAQLYVSGEAPGLKAPIRSLRGFQRLFLKKGESRKIQFILTPGQLSMTDDYGNPEVMKGTVTISISGGQPVSTEEASGNYESRQIQL